MSAVFRNFLRNLGYFSPGEAGIPLDADNVTAISNGGEAPSVSCYAGGIEMRTSDSEDGVMVSIEQNSVTVNANVAIDGECSTTTLVAQQCEFTDVDLTNTFAGPVVAGVSVQAPTVTATTGNFSGTVTGGTVTSTGAVNGASVTATGVVQGASVSATGAVTGASITASGALTGGSVTTSGTVNASNVTTTNNISGANITASGTVTAGTANTSGTATAADVVGTNSVKGNLVETNGYGNVGLIASTNPNTGYVAWSHSGTRRAYMGFFAPNAALPLNLESGCTGFDIAGPTRKARFTDDGRLFLNKLNSDSTDSGVALDVTGAVRFQATTGTVRTTVSSNVLDVSSTMCVLPRRRVAQMIQTTTAQTTDANNTLVAAELLAAVYTVVPHSVEVVYTLPNVSAWYTYLNTTGGGVSLSTSGSTNSYMCQTVIHVSAGAAAALSLSAPDGIFIKGLGFSDSSVLDLPVGATYTLTTLFVNGTSSGTSSLSYFLQ